jgi:hypothetical protein
LFLTTTVHRFINHVKKYENRNPAVSETTPVLQREDVVFNAKMGKYAEAALKFSIKEADIELIASHLSKA